MHIVCYGFMEKLRGTDPYILNPSSSILVKDQLGFRDQSIEDVIKVSDTCMDTHV